jgi:hypothetical protein
MNSQRVSEFMSRKICGTKFFKNGCLCSGIVVYPQNDARELAKIMMDIKIDNLPVVFSPWNKKQIGCVSLNEIRVLLND